jgi:hypothetical protein
MPGSRVAGLLLCALTVAACSTGGADVGLPPTDPNAGRPADGVSSLQLPAPLPGTSRAGQPGGSAGSVVGGRAVAFPAAVLPDGAGVGCPASRAKGWVAAENRRPGTTIALPDGSGGAVLGYLDRGSVGCGEAVDVHLATAPGSALRKLVIAAYRIGWYAGAGARLIWRSSPGTVGPGQIPSGTAYPHLVTPSWSAAARLVPDAGWPPGFYLLVPQDARLQALGPAIPLVVRNDHGGEPLLVKASTLTWNAYNSWGGWSLYRGPGRTAAQQSANRARGVALHRPLIGSGYQQMAFMDLPVVRSAERVAVQRGLDVGYLTDVDLDADPSRLLGHAELVSGGHSEYWTTRMYDGLLAALAAGTNAVFLGANNLWWHARLDGADSAGSAEPQREWVYRSLTEDPAARTDPTQATVLWQSPPLGRDPASVLGQSHAAIAVRGGLQLLDPPSWFVAGSGLAGRAVLAGAVGNEADGYNPRGSNPADVRLLAAGVLRGAQGAVLVSTGYAVMPSGAAVFAAGTTDWACAPTGRCADRSFPAATSRAVTTLTQNVLVAFATPRAGAVLPSGTAGSTGAGGQAAAGQLVGGPAATASALAAVLAPGAFGQYGGEDE